MFQERWSLETPEHVPVEFEVAGPMSRYAAGLYDGLMLFCLVVICSLLALGLALVFSEAVSRDAAIGATAAFLAVVVFGYFPVFEYFRNGQTPGKKALGIRVMRRDMRPLDFASVFLRGVLRIVDFLPGLPFPLVGLVSMSISRRALRLGDLAAGTWVVRDPDLPPHLDGAFFSFGKRAVVRPPRPRTAPGTAAAAAPAGEGRLTAEEFRIARDFVERSQGLDPEKRRAAAVYVAGPILRRLGEQRFDAEKFLREEVAKGPAGKSLL